MPASHRNRLVTTVSAVASAGLGAFTISTASSGYRTFVSGDNGLTFDVLITEGTTWEIRTGCTYTHSGTTLSRGTLEDSSTGSAITFTSACIVTVTASAGLGNLIESALQAVTPGGRLTLTTGVPVTTSDVTGATTIYYTPYLHNIVSLWDGAEWKPTIFAETSEALGTLTSGLNYDVFGFLSSGVLDLEKLAWTNDSTRATAVTLQDGRYCKSGDKTRLYLGTFRTTSTTTTEDSAGGTTSQVGGKRFLWNAYNRVRRVMEVADESASWSYTSTTIRQANAATGNKVEFIAGLSFDSASAFLVAGTFQSTSGQFTSVGIGYDSTTAYSGGFHGLFNNGTSSTFPQSAVWRGMPAAGYHYIARLESGNTNAFFSGLESGNSRTLLSAEVFS